MATVIRMPAPLVASRAVYVAAAGDIGDSRSGGGLAYATGRVLDDLIGRHPDYTPPDGVVRRGIEVDPLGDLAYPNGTFSEFANNYGPYWGSGAGGLSTDPWNYRDKRPWTWPVVGNHESYNDNTTSDPEYKPYDDYYGLRSHGVSNDPDVFKGYYPGVGLPGGRYYARELVAPDGKAYWLHIHYNTHVGETTDVGTYTRQLTWFDSMIACAGATGPTTPVARANGSNVNRHAGFKQHILVSGHHPLMMFGQRGAGDPQQIPYWMKLQAYDGGIKIFMYGHEHVYARCEPIRWASSGASVSSASSSITATLLNGCVQILNGTGGANLNSIPASTPHGDHIVKGVDTDHIMSYLMLEPGRCVYEGVAIDSATKGRQTDGPVALTWGGTVEPPPPPPPDPGTTTPSITSFTPGTGPPGTVVTITGVGFTSIDGVRFGSGAANADFQILSDTSVKATVPTNAVTGTVRVFTTDTLGVVTTYFSSTDYTVTAAPVGAPTITDATPRSGPDGSSVVITGTGFTGVTGVAGVKFNGINAASYVVDSNTQITAVTPTNIGTGPITVTHPTNGTGTSGFSFQGTQVGAIAAALSLDPPRVRLSGVSGGGTADREYTASVTADASGSTYLAGATFTFDWGDGTTTGPQAGASAAHLYSYNHVNAYEKGWGHKTVKVTVIDSSGTGIATAKLMLQRDHILAGVNNGGL